jgi:hypothetical protein
MSGQADLIRWERTPTGERGYLGDEYIGVITEPRPGRLLLRCLLPCAVRTETRTPHITRDGAKAFAEHRVITSLMAAIEGICP